MPAWLSLDYWYVFPFAVLVACAANASGFSGAVLFQPFFNFVLRLPIGQSIATGIATETIGMSSGAFRYWLMGRLDLAAARLLLPPALAGVVLRLLIFTRASRDALRLIVGLVVAAIALYQLANAAGRHFGTAAAGDLRALRRRRWVAFWAGAFSSCTGTGVAELHQPMLEHTGGLATKRANATAIFIEAVADWIITAVNLSLGNLRLDILVFSAAGEQKLVKQETPEGAAQIMEQASLVVVVPGYGMAVAQAQHRVRELYDQLTKRGVDVRFAIHPVAGRMPGHMNVLLAETEIPYDKLVEMDDINPDMPQADVVLVIGANDVVNPAARHDKSSPIYGMPIIDADKAKMCFAIKRSMNPGFAGIDNELYTADHTYMLFGDAKGVVGELVKNLSGGSGMH